MFIIDVCLLTYASNRHTAVVNIVSRYALRVAIGCMVGILSGLRAVEINSGYWARRASMLVFLTECCSQRLPAVINIGWWQGSRVGKLSWWRGRQRFGATGGSLQEKWGQTAHRKKCSGPQRKEGPHKTKRGVRLPKIQIMLIVECGEKKHPKPPLAYPLTTCLAEFLHPHHKWHG